MPADHLRVTGEISVPFEMVSELKAHSATVWVGRLSKKLNIGGKPISLQLITVKTHKPSSLWWTVQESYSDVSLAAVAADFVNSHRCVRHAGQFTCAAAGANGLFVRTIGNRSGSSSVSTQTLLLEAEAMHYYGLQSYKSIDTVTKLFTLYHDPSNIGGPMANFSLRTFGRKDAGWQATIRREDGEAGLIFLNEEFIVKSARRIGKIK